MEVCDGGNKHSHEELCHAGRSCPACDAMDASTELQAEIDNLKEERDGLNDDINGLEEKVSELEGKLAEKTT